MWKLLFTTQDEKSREEIIREIDELIEEEEARLKNRNRTYRAKLTSIKRNTKKSA